MSEAERRRLERAAARVQRAEAGLEEARSAWARTVRALGISAVARQMGLSRQAVSLRVKAAERGSGS